MSRVWIAVTGLVTLFFGAIFYGVPAFAESPSTTLKTTQAVIGLIRKPLRILIIQTHLHGKSFVSGNVWNVGIIKGVTSERGEIYLTWWHDASTGRKFNKPDRFHGTFAPRDARTGSYIKGCRLSEICKVEVNYGAFGGRTGTDRLNTERQLTWDIGASVSHPDDGALVKSECLVTSIQRTLGNPKLGRCVNLGLGGLIAENSGLSFSLIELAIEHNKSEDDESKRYPSNVKRDSLHPILLNLYRYFLDTILLGFVVLTSRICIELSYGRGWFYRRWWNWCGHRLSQFWEWTLSAWFCIFLCGLTVFVVYHGIIAFRLF